MSSNDISSTSAASGAQGTGLWLTAAIAMAIIVGAPLLIHSGVERDQRGGASADRPPAAAVVSSGARQEAEGSAALRGDAATVGGEVREDQAPAVMPSGGGIAFSPGTGFRPGAGNLGAPAPAVEPTRPEPLSSPTPETSAVGPSTGGAEPVLTDQGGFGTGQKGLGRPEPAPDEESYVESAGEGAAGSSVASYAQPPLQQPVSATVPEGGEPLGVAEPAQAQSGEQTAQAMGGEAPPPDLPAQRSIAASAPASAVGVETPARAPRAPVDSYQSRQLAEVMAELRSMQREVEMERRASEAGGSYHPAYGRPYYRFQSAPGAAPGGYGYYRQGPSQYYLPQRRPWGYPGPGPYGRGQVP